MVRKMVLKGFFARGLGRLFLGWRGGFGRGCAVGGFFDEIFFVEADEQTYFFFFGGHGFFVVIEVHLSDAVRAEGRLGETCRAEFRAAHGAFAEEIFAV